MTREEAARWVEKRAHYFVSPGIQTGELVSVILALTAPDEVSEARDYALEQLVIARDDARGVRAELAATKAENELLRGELKASRWQQPPGTTLMPNAEHTALVTASGNLEREIDSLRSALAASKAAGEDARRCAAFVIGAASGENTSLPGMGLCGAAHRLLHESEACPPLATAPTQEACSNPHAESGDCGLCGEPESGPGGTVKAYMREDGRNRVQPRTDEFQRPCPSLRHSPPTPAKMTVEVNREGMAKAIRAGYWKGGDQGVWLAAADAVLALFAKGGA